MQEDQEEEKAPTSHKQWPLLKRLTSRFMIHPAAYGVYPITHMGTFLYESVRTKSVQILAFKCKYSRGEEDNEEQGSNN